VSSLVVAVGLCCAVTLVVNVATRSVSSQRETYAWVQKISRFKYPPSAIIHDASYNGLQGWTANTSFSMPPQELDQFIASTPIKRPLAETGLPRGICAYKLDNNTPHLIGESYEESGQNGYTRLTVFIDTSSRDRYEVFLCSAGD
jgi:hypothetical protein